VIRSAQERAAGAAMSSWLARRAGPLQLVDDALLVVRRAAPGQLARGWLAGLPVGAVALLLYYLERVEGVRTPRVALAAGLVLAFWFRFHVLALLAREFVQALRPSLPLPSTDPGWATLACSASLSALGLWFWGWPLLGLARFSVFAVLGLVPLFALRGAVAPSYLARAACADERGWAALARAVEDTRGARATMLSLELVVSGGFLLLFGNLYALGALLLLLANSVLGLDVAFVAAFLAPDNEFVPMALLGATLLLLEPVRAAISALAFAEARGRNEGADLHAAIDALARERPGTSPDRAATSVRAVFSLLLCVGATSATTHVSAQPDTAATVTEAEARDRSVRSHAQSILRRDEFHEFDAAGRDGLQLVQFLERWFGHKADADPLPAAAPRFELRVPPWAVVVAAVGLLGIVIAFVSAEARKAAAQLPAPSVSTPSSIATPESKSPVLLADAQTLAQAGHYRDALRALYSATLAAFDRAGLIRFDPSCTNGQYVRSLPAGKARQQFGAFTQTFESKWYGDESVTAADYAQARSAAEALCQIPEREG